MDVDNAIREGPALSEASQFPPIPQHVIVLAARGRVYWTPQSNSLRIQQLLGVWLVSGQHDGTGAAAALSTTQLGSC